MVRYADRIEFANPGGMRIGVDVAFAGGITDARNAAIARMFSLIGAGERAGSGLEYIRVTSERNGLPRPVLSEGHNPDRTKLTLFMVPDDDNRALWSKGHPSVRRGEPRGQGSTVSLVPVVLPGESDRERLIRLLVAEHRVSRSDVQHKLDLGETKAKRLLVSLRDEGILDSHGAGRGTYYTLAR